ncbi:MAG: transporter substrate-binding domain-containing protein [Clostridia bacterium]|nr:transporter substrate-binding domain-containing protein [Clostridia bacterium]
MKRTLSLLLAVLVTVFAFVSCSNQKTDISGAQSLADLAGAKIAAQAGTFHADAMMQIENVKSSTYPEFSDLLTALKSGAIDGYIAEEPTALFACLADETLDYLRLKNNTTGFTATENETGIAIAVKTDSALREQINSVLAEISEDVRYNLMLQMADLSAGKTVESLVLSSEIPENPTGTLRIAMECAYEPFNWTDLNTPSLGAVPIYGEGGVAQEGRYANGYDVQIAQYVANKLGLKLEIYAYEWDALIPAVQSGAVDAIVAGMSPTPDREAEVDFTNMYYTSNLVVIYKK